MVDLGMTFVDNWGVGKEKGCYSLSNDNVGLCVLFGMQLIPCHFDFCIFFYDLYSVCLCGMNVFHGLFLL